MRQAVNKIIFFVCFSLLASAYWNCAFSQKKPKVKKTFRADFEIPRPLGNKAFDTLFSGVYNVNLSMNFGVKNFNTGVYGGMMQCQIFPRFQSDPHAIQTVYSGGIRFSYDIFPSKEKMASTEGNFLMYSPFISVGYSSVNYSRLKSLSGQPSPTGKHSSTYNVSGGINLNLMFSEYDGVGFTLGYTFLNHTFNPDPLSLNQYYPDIKESDKHGLSSYFLFGFNWYVDLLKREKGTH
jgi:hypothetical protein